MAAFDYTSTGSTQLSFRKGDRMAIISKNAAKVGWWKAVSKGTIGFVPASYVVEVVETETERSKQDRS